jgi:hypothetical protein
MALLICVRIARLLGFAAFLSLTLAAADYPQLLAEFRKTNPDVSMVHVMAETPLLVAVTGPQGTRQTPSDWGKGQLLGVFAHRGDQIVPITVLPTEIPSAVWVDQQTPDSITLALSDPDNGVRSENLKIFFDPKSYFPKRIVRFAPVHVRRIALVAGVLTLSGSDGKQDFTARERNGAWRISTAPLTTPAAPKPVESEAQVTAMPVSTIGEFEKARPERIKHGFGAFQIAEKIGPYQRVGNRIWVGKTFYDGEGSTGVGDIGSFDLATQNWEFLHIHEMADWSTSAILVEPDVIWVGRVLDGEGAGSSGGLLRYERTTRKASIIPLADIIVKIVRVGKRLYCGTSGGFAIVDLDRAKRYEFTPQMDGTYTITPVI